LPRSRGARSALNIYKVEALFCDWRNDIRLKAETSLVIEI